jgi:hypothetical protein
MKTKIQKIRKIQTCAGILGVMLAGCDPSSNLGGFSSSIDGATQIDQLNAQQRQTLCGETMSFAQSSGLDRDTHELTCREGGILAAYLIGTPTQTDAELRAICKDSYDSCLAQTSSSTCDFSVAPGTCSATVAELSECVNDIFKLTEMTTSSVPKCDQITAATLQTSTTPTQQPQPPEPTSCDSYRQKCPGLMM